jgi:hypothetical protein
MRKWQGLFYSVFCHPSPNTKALCAESVHQTEFREVVKEGDLHNTDQKYGK